MDYKIEIVGKGIEKKKMIKKEREVIKEERRLDIKII